MDAPSNPRFTSKQNPDADLVADFLANKGATKIPTGKSNRISGRYWYLATRAPKEEQVSIHEWRAQQFADRQQG